MKNVKGSGGEAPKGLARPAPTIPHWVTESLQWAHSLMMVRWLVMYVVVDGWLYASVYCGAASLIGMLIFSRIKTSEQRAKQDISTLTNSFFCMNLTRGIFLILSTVFEALAFHFWGRRTVLSVVSLAVVVAGITSSNTSSNSWHYAAILAWELLVLPAAAILEESDSNIRHIIHVPIEQKLGAYIVPLSLLLHRIDPYSLSIRRCRLIFNPKLEVPWDPVVY